jgi:RNA polymerase sigma factor (sigma-70 family)
MNLVLPLRKLEVVTLNWDALYTDHIGRIYNFFRYRVGDTSTAEDLTSAAFEKAWNRRGQYRGNAENFAAWLYTISRNIANDYFRKSHPLVHLEAVGDLLDPQHVDEQVEKEQEFNRLVTAINQLPQRERDIITLKYGADLNNRQISAQLRISETNVGTILNRTIQRLRIKLEINDER